MTTHYYIFLENVRFYSYHGVAPQETAIGNEFIINLRLKTDFGKATETDEVEDTVSYADIHDRTDCNCLLGYHDIHNRHAD